MEDHRLGRPLGPQHIEHFSVGVAVVDHQRLARPLGQLDMPGERFGLLGGIGTTLQPAGPVQVQPGLPDRHHPGVGGEPLDFGLGFFRQRVGPGRVQRHGGIDPVVPFGGLGHPSRRVEIVGDRDDGPYPYRRRAIHD